jgi:hypothetical protein
LSSQNNGREKHIESAHPPEIFGCAAHGSRTSCALTGGRSDNFFLSLSFSSPPLLCSVSSLLPPPPGSHSSSSLVVALVVPQQSKAGPCDGTRTHTRETRWEAASSQREREREGGAGAESFPLFSLFYSAQDRSRRRSPRASLS